MKKTLSLLLILMLALQSLVAAADVHHVLNAATMADEGHHHEQALHLSQQADDNTPEPFGPLTDHPPSCHAHASLLPCLTPHAPASAQPPASQERIMAHLAPFSSWITPPALRPPSH